jgi:hypothetical protein
MKNVMAHDLPSDATSVPTSEESLRSVFMAKSGGSLQWLVHLLHFILDQCSGSLSLNRRIHSVNKNRSAERRVSWQNGFFENQEHSFHNWHHWYEFNGEENYLFSQVILLGDEDALVAISGKKHTFWSLSGGKD